MSKHNDNSASNPRQENINDVSVTTTQRSLHQAFTWLHDDIKHDPNAQFAEDVTIVAMGARTIAEILQMHQVDQGAIESGNTAVTNLLSASDISALTGLLVHSLKNIAVAAEERIDHLYFKAREGEQT